ncbi:hypothetical protein [Romboutsia ilealis]|uniref:hypothetical protein n=1 Tax=Romboutsia ilealis TaxID=1115758 RepID=UPI002573E1DA|nr:hypothetical protein [Romboutsia ilealis]
MIKINNKIKITFKNGFVRIIERDNIQNFNSLVDWLEKFNKGEEVPFLTMSGRDLGSAIAINKNNIKSIEFINK